MGFFWRGRVLGVVACALVTLATLSTLAAAEGWSSIVVMRSDADYAHARRPDTPLLSQSWTLLAARGAGESDTFQIDNVSVLSSAPLHTGQVMSAWPMAEHPMENVRGMFVVADQRGDTVDVYARARDLKELWYEAPHHAVHGQMCYESAAGDIGGVAYLPPMRWYRSDEHPRRVFVWSQGTELRMGTCGASDVLVYTSELEVQGIFDVVFGGTCGASAGASCVGTVAWAELPAVPAAFHRTDTIARLELFLAEVHVPRGGVGTDVELRNVQRVVEAFVKPHVGQRLAMPLALHDDVLWYGSVENANKASSPMRMFRVDVHTAPFHPTRFDSPASNDDAIHSIGVQGSTLWSVRRLPFAGSSVVLQDLRTGAVATHATPDTYGQVGFAECSQPGARGRPAFVATAMPGDVPDTLGVSRIVELCAGDGLSLEQHVLYGGYSIERLQLMAESGHIGEMWMAVNDTPEPNRAPTYSIRHVAGPSETILDEHVVNVEGELLGYAHTDFSGADVLRVMHRRSDNVVSITTHPSGQTLRNFVTTTLADAKVQASKHVNGNSSVLVASQNAENKVVVTRHVLDAQHTSLGQDGVVVAQWDSPGYVDFAESSASDEIYAIAASGLVHCTAPAWMCTLVHHVPSDRAARVAVDENDAGDVLAVWVFVKGSADAQVPAQVLHVAAPSGTVHSRNVTRPTDHMPAIAAHNGVAVLTQNAEDVLAIRFDAASAEWSEETWGVTPGALRSLHASCAANGSHCDLWGQADGSGDMFKLIDHAGERWGAWPDQVVDAKHVSVWPELDTNGFVWLLDVANETECTLVAVHEDSIVAELSFDLDDMPLAMTHRADDRVVWLTTETKVVVVRVSEHATAIESIHTCPQNLTSTGQIVFVPEPAPGRLYILGGPHVNTCVVDPHTLCCVEEWVQFDVARATHLSRLRTAAVVTTMTGVSVVINETVYPQGDFASAWKFRGVAPSAVDPSRLVDGNALSAYAIVEPRMTCISDATTPCSTLPGVYTMAALDSDVVAGSWETLMSHSDREYSAIAVSHDGAYRAVLYADEHGRQTVDVTLVHSGQHVQIPAQAETVAISVNNETLWMLTYDDDDVGLLLLAYVLLESRQYIAATFSGLSHRFHAIATDDHGGVFVLVTRTTSGVTEVWEMDLHANTHRTVAESAPRCVGAGIEVVPSAGAVVWTAQCVDGAHMWSCPTSADSSAECEHVALTSVAKHVGPRRVPARDDLVLWFVDDVLVGVNASTLAFEPFHFPFAQSWVCGVPTDFAVTQKNALLGAFASQPFMAEQGGVFEFQLFANPGPMQWQPGRLVQGWTAIGAVTWDAFDHSWLFGQAYDNLAGAGPLYRLAEGGYEPRWLPSTAAPVLLPQHLSVDPHTGSMLFVDAWTDAVWTAPTEGFPEHIAMLALGDVNQWGATRAGGNAGATFVWLSETPHSRLRICTCDLGLRNDQECMPRLVGVLPFVGALSHTPLIDADADNYGHVTTVVCAQQIISMTAWHTVAQGRPGVMMRFFQSAEQMVMSHDVEVGPIALKKNNAVEGPNQVVASYDRVTTPSVVVHRVIPGTLVSTTFAGPAPPPIDLRLQGVWQENDPEQPPAAIFNITVLADSMSFDASNLPDGPEEGIVNTAYLHTRVAFPGPSSFGPSTYVVRHAQSDVNLNAELFFQSISVRGSYTLLPPPGLPSPTPTHLHGKTYRLGPLLGGVLGAMVAIAAGGYYAARYLRRRSATARGQEDTYTSM